MFKQENEEQVLKKKILDLEQKLINAETDVQVWKDKYYNLRQSNAYPLTEETGKMIISVLQKSGIKFSLLIVESQK